MIKYSVTVGNVGTVYDGDDRDAAGQVFGEYRRQAREGLGRAAGERVVLWHDGEPWAEYCPLLHKAEVTAAQAAVSEARFKLAEAELRLARYTAPTLLYQYKDAVHTARTAWDAAKGRHEQALEALDARDGGE